MVNGHGGAATTYKAEVFSVSSSPRILCHFLRQLSSSSGGSCMPLVETILCASVRQIHGKSQHGPTLSTLEDYV
jgi:hypothetical protein